MTAQALVPGINNVLGLGLNDGVNPDRIPLPNGGYMRVMVCPSAAVSVDAWVERFDVPSDLDSLREEILSKRDDPSFSVDYCAGLEHAARIIANRKVTR